MRFFVTPRRGENEEEDKTKSLSVNPFRSWGFPWLRQKGATWGDPKRKGGEPITFLTLHNHLSLESFCTSVLASMTRHSSGSYHLYTNNNYPAPLALQSQAVDH